MTGVWTQGRCAFEKGGSARAHTTNLTNATMVLQALTDRLQKRLENVDWVTFLTRDVVMIVTTHLQTLRQTDSSLEHFPSHPALVSDEAEIR